MSRAPTRDLRRFIGLARLSHPILSHRDMARRDPTQPGSQVADRSMSQHAARVSQQAVSAGECIQRQTHTDRQIVHIFDDAASERATCQRQRDLVVLQRAS
jgi:hypothetical protein